MSKFAAAIAFSKGHSIPVELWIDVSAASEEEAIEICRKSEKAHQYTMAGYAIVTQVVVPYPEPPVVVMPVTAIEEEAIEEEKTSKRKKAA